MALVLKDRVKETSTSTGTGDFVLAGAADGFQSFTDALADGDTTYYAIEDGTDWETGLGTWTESTTTLARTTVYESSNSGNAVDWGAGDKTVFITQPASRVSNTVVYDSIDDLPLSGNVQAGDQAYVSGNNRLYLYNGTGWYNIALVNTTPTVSGNSATYELATDGTATTVTLTGTDPEGVPLTWSATTSGDTNAAAVTNVDNVFTITPSTNTSNAGTITVTFRASDGVNIATASSEFSLTFISALWADVALSIGTSSTNSLDNSTFTDRSSSSNTVTTSGTPTQTAFHPYLDNWSVEFDGTDDYIQVSHESGFDFGTGDFTVEMWASFESTSTIESLAGTYANNGADGWLLQKRDNGTLKWWIGSTEISSGTFTPTIGSWHHLAASRDNGTLKLFVDGSQIASTSHTADIAYTAPITIGRLSHTTAPQWFNGRMSNLRVVKGTALYTSGFTPSTTSLTNVTNTTFLGLKSNRFINEVNSSSSFTLYSAPKISAFSPFGQESEYATGENKGSGYLEQDDYVTAADDVDLDVSSAYTAEAWIYVDTFPSGSIGASGQGFVMGRWTATGNQRSWAIFLGNGGGISLYHSATGSSSYTTATASTGTITNNAWHHVAGTWDGTTMRLFVDGDVVASTADTSGPYSTPSAGVTINSINVSLTGTGVKQYISDARYITNQALYTSDFTPPTSPVGNTNASLYLPMDNAGIFDKTGNHDLTLNGDTSTSTTQTKFADTSVYFDGTGDYITVSEGGAFGTNSWTIEAWVYRTGTGTRAIIGHNTAISNTNGFTLVVNSSNQLGAYWASAYQATVAGFTSNQWVHVAATYDGTNLRLFTDGTLGATSAESINFTIDDFFIGNNASNQYWQGYIENFQIHKGVAKYTANFTAPTSEQGRTYQAED